MKTTYHMTFSLIVHFDDVFQRTYNSISINKIEEVVKDEMWCHDFTTAQVFDRSTDERIMTIEREE